MVIKKKKVISSLPLYSAHVLSSSTTKDTENNTLLAYFNGLIGDKNTSPFAQTKLFVAGRETDGKEDFLVSLFGSKNLENEEDVWEHKIVRGHFDARSFSKVEVAKLPTLESPRLVLWDYTWKPEYSFAEHLFISEKAVYIVLFDARCLLKDEEKASTLKYLKLLLGSKTVFGSDSSCLLVGTYCQDLSEEDIKTVNTLIENDVIVAGGFAVIYATNKCFFATDASSGLNNDLVKKTLTETILTRDHVKQVTPNFLLRLYKKLILGKSGYISLQEISKFFTKKFQNGFQAILLLQLMTIQGLLFFYPGVEELEKFIIYRPEFLLKVIRVVLFRQGDGYTIDFDNFTQTNGFMNLNVNKILEENFYDHILERMGYTDPALLAYLKRLMLYTRMIAPNDSDLKSSFIVPTLYKDKRSNIKSEHFSGARFIFDFSGQNHNVFYSRKYIKYMPTGFYEKLVVTCLQLSASCRGTQRPIVEYHKAQISFGGVMIFCLALVNDTNDLPNWIECKVISAANWDHVNKIIRRLYLMIKGVQYDFYSSQSFELSITILLQSSEESGGHLSEYTKIIRSNRKDEPIEVISHGFQFLLYKDFHHWFGEAPGQSFKPFSPEEMLGYIPPAGKKRSLPNGMKYHVFLSYKATNTAKLVRKQYEILTKIGYTCWLDSVTGGENITKEDYIEGVKKCVCFALVLSQDIFDSPLILQEIETAHKEGKKIILLHQPDTGKLGKLQFSEYVEKAPKNLKIVFETSETFQLEKRFYLQETVTNYLTRSIDRLL